MRLARALVPAGILLTMASGVAAHDGWHSVRHGEGPTVTGSGRIVTENRNVPNFRAIALRGFGDVEARLGARPSLAISADDNLLPHLITRVEGDTLVIDSRGSFTTRVTPRIVVTVPDVNYVTIVGSGDVRLSGVNNAALSLVIRGSGDISAQGRTRDLSVRIAGSGDTDVRALQSDTADVRVQGSGDVRVSTNGALDASISWSGTIYYAGNPRPLNVRRSGSGSVVAVQ